MSVTIKRQTNLSDEDKECIFGWGENIFENAHLNIRWGGSPTWRFVGYADGDPVSHVGLLEHTIHVGKQPVKVGGICSVVTVPSARNKGYARVTLQAVAEYMRDELKVPFGFLFCLDRLIPFYGQFGWQTIAHSVRYDQPSGTVEIPKGLNAMVLSCREQEWPEGVVELNRLPW